MLGTIVRHLHAEPSLPGGPAPKPDSWLTLTLDVTGHIVGAHQDLVHLLGSQTDALTGKAVRSVIPGIPFSANTPGYNLAYAIVHSAEVRRTARLADGHGILVDTVLSSSNANGDRRIFLKLRPSCFKRGGSQ